MALNLYCAFSLAGTALSGEVTMTSVGGVDVSTDHIEGYELHFGRRIDHDGTTSRASGPRRIEPVRLCKRADATTPLLYQELAQNQRLDGDIKLFDVDPDSGETRHRFTVRLTQSRIVGVHTTSPDVLDPDTKNRPITEWLDLVPHTMAYIDEVNGTEANVWSGPA